jgi:hypothetical protein
MVYICCIKYVSKARVSVLAVGDDELDVGNNELDAGDSEVASFGQCRGGSRRGRFWESHAEDRTRVGKLEARAGGARGSHAEEGTRARRLRKVTGTSPEGG